MKFATTVRGKLALAFSLVALLTAINSVQGLYFTNSVGERGLHVGERLAPLIYAADKLQVEAAKAHILLEEIMGGDQTEDIEEVWALLNRSLWYADAILNGGENESGQFHAAESPAVRSKIEEVKTAINEFILVSRERHENYLLRSGAGTDADEQFDALYEDVLSAIDRVTSEYTASQANYMSVLRNAAEAKYLLANAHLYLEERLAGDHSEELADILAGFAAAKERVGRLRRVGLTSEIEPIMSQFDRLIAVASERNSSTLTGTAAGGEYDARVDRSFEAFVRAADAAADLLKTEIQNELAQARSYESTSLLALGGISGLIFLLASTLGYGISRSITGRVGRLSAEMQALSKGHLGTQISFVEDADEIGGMARTLAEFRETSVLAARGKAALDSASASFMITDDKHTIIELNSAAVEMFRDASDGIRTGLPEFEVDELIGSSASTLQSGLLEEVSSIERTRLQLGDRTFELTIAPVINVDGNRLGTVTEWKDITEQLAVESEIAGIVRAATEGDFSARLTQSNKNDFMADLAQGINELLDVTDAGLSQVVNVVSALSEGNLTTRMVGEHRGAFARLQQDVDRMGRQMEAIIGRIADVSSAVYTAAEEISAGVADLSVRTEHQASSLEETTASMEELATTVRQNAENAQEANQIASAAREAAVAGGSIAGQAVEAMTRIEQSSKQITEIVGLIQEIAFQTNLLALNASVEAARAGEAGRGFAVVANEVRALAQRAGQASKDIKELIVNSDAQVRSGVGLVNKAGDSLEDIVNLVKKVADVVSEIAAASQEQAAGIEQVSTAVSGMDEMTQQNAALVEETTAALQSAQGQIGELQGAVGFFQTGVRPGADAPSQTGDTGSSAAARSSSVRPAQPGDRSQTNAVREQQLTLARRIAAPAAAALKFDESWEEF